MNAFSTLGGYIIPFRYKRVLRYIRLRYNGSYMYLFLQLIPKNRNKRREIQYTPLIRTLIRGNVSYSALSINGEPL